MSLSNFEEFEQQLEEIFEKADHLMITQKKYDEAVSYFEEKLHFYHFLTKFFSNRVEISISENSGYGRREYRCHEQLGHMHQALNTTR